MLETSFTFIQPRWLGQALENRPFSKNEVLDDFNHWPLPAQGVSDDETSVTTSIIGEVLVSV
jgi:hypothetical protein